MKRLIAWSMLIILPLLLVGCGKQEPTSTEERNKAIADKSIDILGGLYGVGRAMDSQGGNSGGKGEGGTYTVKWDTTIYIDETRGGVHLYGWATISDGGTPGGWGADTVVDSTLADDDWFKFDGTVEYIDWDFKEEWDFTIYPSPYNRTADLMSTNPQTNEEAIVRLNRVNRRGGVQQGDQCYYISAQGDSLKFTHVVYHNETVYEHEIDGGDPDADNWSAMLFPVRDDQNNSYLVDIHFYPDNYGWIVDRSLAGYIKSVSDDELVATFYCNILGWGEITLINGYTYPFAF